MQTSMPRFSLLSSRFLLCLISRRHLHLAAAALTCLIALFVYLLCISTQTALAKETSAINVSEDTKIASLLSDDDAPTEENTLEQSMDDSWFTVYLKNGANCDISKSSSNTRLVINKSGVYTFRGSSGKVRLDVVGGSDVTIVLADGFNLHASALSNTGKQCAGINIEDFAGTVTIKTKSKATAKVSGYFGECGIRKAGTKGKLVFETEDPNNPGTLIAKGSYRVWVNAPGIGRLKGTTGNIFFESGIIQATGGDGNAPDIGIDDVSNYPEAPVVPSPHDSVTSESNGEVSLGGGLCDGITINGGTIKAQGGTLKGLNKYGGAGIGGGTSTVKNLIINGGDVTATGGHAAAGIGGGWYSGDLFITINGGNVVSRGKAGGSGIGAGEKARGTTNVTINGGHVFATGGDGRPNATGIDSAPGIGGGYYDSYAATNIIINGGKIKATGGTKRGNSVGIGSHLWSSGESKVTINGGYVTANPGRGNIMIGGAGHGRRGWGSSSVVINGGTVTHEQSDDSNIVIGSESSRCSAVITGGNVRAKSITNATNEHKARVVRSKVALNDQTYGESVESLTTIGLGNPHYGLKDVKTLDNGTLYLWFPQGSTAKPAAITIAEISNEKLGTLPFGGEVKTGTDGTLCRATPIKLVGNGEGADDGSAVGLTGQKKLTGYEALTRAGYTLDGYTSDPDGGALIAQADGTLLAGTNYTDENSAWDYGHRQEVELYAQWRPHAYTVSFNANVPHGCSSTAEGSLDDMSVFFGQSYQAPPTKDTNAYILKGYLLNSWNTKPDGTGETVELGKEFKNLTTQEGDKVVLYAQWRPWNYEVTLKGIRDGSEAHAPHVFTYDKTATLPSIKSLGYESPNPGNPVFLGWKNTATIGGGLYTDEASVVNLCGTNEGGMPTGYTLEAVWGSPGHVYVLAMDIDENSMATPLSGIGNELSLVGGTKTYTNVFTEEEENAGIYAAENIDAGNYTLYRNNKSTGMTKVVNPDETIAFTLYYSTIKTESGEGLTTEISLDGTTWTTELADVVFDPTDCPRVHIRSEVSNGYKFQSYVATGVAPDFEQDTGVANQDMTIHGPATIKSYSAPLSYTVVFEKNADDATGSMERQAFNQNEEKKLLNNRYQRLGYSFNGWNTKPDGTGTPYKNEQEVKNLTTEDEGLVTLYAQWKPNTYYVKFAENAAGVEGHMGRQEIKYGEPTSLNACEFTLEGHHFVEWATEPDGTGKTFSDKKSVESLTTENEGVITLYAQWERDYFTVEFNSNDGTSRTETQTVLTDTSYYLQGNPFNRIGYSFLNWATKPDGSGITYKNGAKMNPNTVESGEILPLYAQWKTHTYTVSFDVNTPRGCSTTPSGSMNDRKVSYDDPTDLHNKFSLPGYKFTGWNTNPDGTGDAYLETDRKNLTNENGSSITLYAQWEAQTYTVTLSGYNEHSGHQSRGFTCIFDQPTTLPGISELGYSDPAGNGSFLGWRNRNTFDSNLGGLYSDKAQVINLCGFVEGDDKPHGFTLNSQWTSGNAQAYITVMHNHENGNVTPMKGLANKLSLVDGTTTYGGFAEDSQQKGVYVIDEAEKLPAGTYDIKLEGYDTAGKTITIETNKTATTALNYCTIKTKSEKNLSTKISHDGNTWKTKLDNTLMGSDIYLCTTSKEDSGYKLQSYSATGISPKIKNTPEKQAITVLGASTINSHNEPITYNIKYVANSDKAIGDMPVLDGIPYDFEFMLDPCEFTHPTRTFKGWNTAADGSGTRYEDCDKVKNLTTKDCTEVVLYAQWENEPSPEPEPDPKPSPSPSPSPTPGIDDPKDNSSDKQSNSDSASTAQNTQRTATTGDSMILPIVVLAITALGAVGALVAWWMQKGLYQKRFWCSPFSCIHDLETTPLAAKG